MELWTLWTHALQAALAWLGLYFGLSEAAAIVLLTLMVRAGLMPVSLPAAYRMQMNKQAMARLKPQLDELRRTFKLDARERAARTMALYRDNGIAVVDKLTVLNLLTQGAFGLGLFHTLKRMVFSTRFLWIPDLAKPDLWLSLVVSALMLLGMALMPGAFSDPSMLLMLVVAVVVSAVAVAALPSAIGVYWATSSAVTLVQTLALRGLVARRNRTAA